MQHGDAITCGDKDITSHSGEGSVTRPDVGALTHSGGDIAACRDEGDQLESGASRSPVIEKQRPPTCSSEQLIIPGLLICG